MKKWSFLLPAILLSVSGFSQNPAPVYALKGIVIDSATLQAIGYVTVILQIPKSGKSIKTTVTKSDGSFVLKRPLDNPYSLVFTSVGYASKIISINADSSEIDLGKVSLVRSATKLKEVSVTMVKPIVTREV